MDNQVIDTLVNIISNFDVDDLHHAISHEENLSITIDISIGENKNALKWLSKNVYYDEIKQMKTEDVLMVLYTKRPDLYKVICTHPSGYQWITKNVLEVKEFLLR